jgi:hypothetical protein
MMWCVCCTTNPHVALEHHRVSALADRLFEIHVATPPPSSPWGCTKPCQQKILDYFTFRRSLLFSNCVRTLASIKFEKMWCRESSRDQFTSQTQQLPVGSGEKNQKSRSWCQGSDLDRRPHCRAAVLTTQLQRSAIWSVRGNSLMHTLYR